MKQLLFNKYKLSIIGLAIVFLIGSYFETFQIVENWAYGVVNHEHTSKPSAQVTAVVAIDDDSITQTGPWPWPRDKLAKLIQQINSFNPRTINLLIDLSSAQTPPVHEKLANESKKIKNPKIKTTLHAYLRKINTDQYLINELKRNPKVHIAGFYRYTPKQLKIPKELVDQNLINRISEKPIYRTWLDKLNINPFTANIQLIPPHPSFARYAKSGLVELNHREQPVNSIPLVIKIGDYYFSSLALRLSGYYGAAAKQSIEIIDDSKIRVGRKILLTSQGYSYYPLLTSKWTTQTPVTTISAARLKFLNKNILRNKHVFVGLTDKNHANLVKLANGITVPLPQWYAHLTQGLIKNKQINVPYYFYAYQRLLIIIFAILLLFTPIRFYGKYGYLISLLIATLLLNSGLIIFVLQQLWLPLIVPVSYLLVSHTLLFFSYRKQQQLEQARLETSEIRRELGGFYQTQGNLLQAFEHYQKCTQTDEMPKTLYNLGLEFERRRQFDRALEVYQHIHKNQGRFYKDSETRISRLKEVTSKFPSTGFGTTSATQLMVVEDLGVEKPMLGRYQLERELGRGAMGMVYLGLDPKIGRKVAIKTLSLSDEFEGKALEESEKRFFREAEAVGRLTHPNIVTIFDVGEDQGVAYIAMDYIEGETLAKHMFKEKLLKIRIILQIAAKVADALAYAHERNVIHRDIKPANIMFNPHNSDVKVTDFGIASLTDDSRTKTGTVLGSPSYMSPEQISARKITGKSDQFSLAVTMYQLLTGHLPFDGDSMANLMFQITNQPHRPIRKIRRGIPPCVSRIINKALQKQPENRFADCKAMAAAIRKCLDQM